MTNKDNYKTTMNHIHTSRNYLEEVEKMKPMNFRRIAIAFAVACIACITPITAYAYNIGGFRSTIQYWVTGEQVQADLIVDGYDYTISYTDADGQIHTHEGGGIAYEPFGKERPLSQEEILEQLSEPEVIVQDDQYILYWYDQVIDITDLLEGGKCKIELHHDKEKRYVTITKEGTGISMAIDKYGF